MLNGVPSGSREHLADKFRPLIVRQVTALAENTGDQVRRPAGSSLQGDIMVEFDAQDINIGNRVGHRVCPAAGVGQVSESEHLLPPLRGDLHPKSECRPAVVAQRDRLDPESVGKHKRMKVILPGQPDTL